MLTNVVSEAEGSFAIHFRCAQHRQRTHSSDPEITRLLYVTRRTPSAVLDEEFVPHTFGTRLNYSLFKRETKEGAREWARLTPLSKRRRRQGRTWHDPRH